MTQSLMLTKAAFKKKNTVSDIVKYHYILKHLNCHCFFFIVIVYFLLYFEM